MTKQRKVRRALKIAEISGVDRPAQEGAKALIMKRADIDTLIANEKAKAGSTQSLARDDTGPSVAKNAALTNAVLEHSHLVYMSGIEGEWDAGTTSYQDDHTHPWVRQADGSIVLGEVNGHTHEVQTLSKRVYSSEQREKLADEGKAMPDGGYPIVDRADLANAIKAFGRASNKAAVARHIKARARALDLTDMLPEEGKLAELIKSAGEAGETVRKENDMSDTNPAAPTVEELQAKLERVTALAEFNDAQKAHFKGLDEEAQKAFIAKSADERQAEVDEVTKAANEADPVVYKTAAGLEIRKSAGEAMVAIAKSNDKLIADNAKLAKAAEDAAFEKRAEDELGFMPGDVATRVALLKSVEGIEDEAQRKAALDALHAHNETFKSAHETVGHGGQPKVDSTAVDKLDELAKKYAEDNEVSVSKAYDAVLQTEKGAELYAKSIG